MVKLEEVPDEELFASQQGPKEDEDEWDTDDADSEVSDVEDDDDFDESLLDRVYALKDMVPPTYRKKANSIATSGYEWAASIASFSGKSLWVISTSALLLGVPWALAFSEEQQVQEMEREMRMQQSANELLTQGGGQTDARPAL